MSKDYSPAEYAEILDKIEVKQISITDLVAKCYVENVVTEKINIDVNNTVKFQRNEKNNDFNGIDKFQFIGKNVDKTIFEIDLSLMVYFTSSIKIDDEFLNLFQQNSLKLFSFPYIRQCVHDLSFKMGLPPLILPLWKIHRKSKDEMIDYKRKINLKKNIKSSRQRLPQTN